jgi:hypothetical protein
MEIQYSKPHWLPEMDMADPHAANYLILSASDIQKRFTFFLSQMSQRLPMYIKTSWILFQMLKLSPILVNL